MAAISVFADWADRVSALAGSGGLSPAWSETSGARSRAARFRIVFISQSLLENVGLTDPLKAI
jgi:hypothetical protein